VVGSLQTKVCVLSLLLRIALEASSALLWVCCVDVGLAEWCGSVLLWRTHTHTCLQIAVNSCVERGMVSPDPMAALGRLVEKPWESGPEFLLLGQVLPVPKLASGTLGGS
jgi:hypothetical protein